MARSLAETLADLANPEPKSQDPEDFEFGSDRESKSDNEEARAHYVEVEKSRLRADQDVAVDYSSKPVSRKDFEQSEESGDSEESEEDSESEDESEAEMPAIQKTELSAHKRKEIAAQLAAEKRIVAERLSQTTQDDVQKGKSIAAQYAVYEGILDARITFQKILGLSNVGDENINKDEAENALDGLKLLLNSIHDLRVKLSPHEQEPQSESSTDNKSLKRKLEQCQELDNELNVRRGNVLQRWSRKVQLSSGTAVLQDSKFKSLNQSWATQVENSLGDMDKLAKRTKTNRSGYKPAGFDEAPEEDEFIYDDTDFYKLLLKDLVSRRMADSAASGGVRWTAAKSKVKKSKDNRVSKGRKLRYDVQEKIQGFDAPRNRNTWTDEQADELFSGLFGMQLELDEAEPEAEKQEVVVEDGYALFA